MKPYYQDKAVTIYHVDCREVTDEFVNVDVDLVLTDPPYGIGYSPSENNSPSAHCKKQFVGKMIITGDDLKFDPGFLLGRFQQTSYIILWGANNYADKLPVSQGWLVWDKREGSTSNTFADCELAWSNLTGAARLYHHLWNGTNKKWDGIGKRIGAANSLRVHPTQKPESVMRWCVSLAKLNPGSLIFDPFMGSGTTLRAAKDMGHRSIGIEIEEKYCEIAAERMRQEVMEYAA